MFNVEEYNVGPVLYEPSNFLVKALNQLEHPVEITSYFYLLLCQLNHIKVVGLRIIINLRVTLVQWTRIDRLVCEGDWVDEEIKIVQPVWQYRLIESCQLLKYLFWNLHLLLYCG